MAVCYFQALWLIARIQVYQEQIYITGIDMSSASKAVVYKLYAAWGLRPINGDSQRELIFKVHTSLV